MKKLNSITLSNLRKFGSDVEIELSPGATIVLAPNGTGKTTLFEAIEFGLTGKIARLAGDIKHVIRDDESFAQVDLNFGDFSARSKVTSAGNVTQEGDLTAIFPDIPEKDLPFLLRLTHLLDQRENEWIVKADKAEAGSQLTKLPIGREGSQVSAMLTSVKRSLTDQKNRERQDLSGLERELNEWHRLIQERDLAVAGAAGVLRPQEYLFKVLSETAVNTSSLDQIPAGLLSEPVNQDTLALAHSTLSEIIRNKIDHAQSLISGLTEADGLVKRFNAVRARLDEFNTRLASAYEALDTNSTIHANTANLIQDQQTKIKLAQQERVRVEQSQERLVNENSARQQVEHRNKEFLGLKIALKSAEELYAVLSQKHEHNLQVRNQHYQLDNQLQLLDQVENQLVEGGRLIVEWEAAEEQLKQGRAEIDLLEGNLVRLTSELAEKRTIQDACKTAEHLARSHYQTLSSSTDAIRQAVASISEHLHSDQESCPLCLYPHGSRELHERIAKALQAINPSLTIADQQLKAAVEALAGIDVEVASALDAVGACRVQLEMLDDICLALERDIFQLRASPLVGGDSIASAKESLRVKSESVSTNRKTLTSRRLGLEPMIGQEDFEEAKRTSELSAAELDHVRTKCNESLSRLNQAVAALSAITVDAPSVQALEELIVQKSSLDERIHVLSGHVNVGVLELNAQQRKLDDLKSSVRGVEDAIRHDQSQLASIRASWHALALQGDPLSETAQACVSTQHSMLANLKANLELLEKVGVEISAWTMLTESQLAQRIIDGHRLEQTEESFTADLEARIKLATIQLADLTNLSAAMEDLDVFLKKEIGNVQNHIRKVVPRWRALLKRIVRETRFHEASLNFFTHYNKEKAEVLVPLGKKSAPVPDVASEAQLTDLQLTFLLSMAMSHNWSNWKALLLDDPTQHHDLVHASAVFDLLRDYIVDHGFQIVIATHDALQARYFLRKLQNDGIEAKIWTLVPTDSGVTAEEGHWRKRMRVD